MIAEKKLFRKRKGYAIYFVPYSESEIGLLIQFFNFTVTGEGTKPNQTYVEVQFDPELSRQFLVDCGHAKRQRHKVIFEKKE